MDRFDRDGKLYHRTGDRWIPVQTGHLPFPNTEEQSTIIPPRARAQRSGKNNLYFRSHKANVTERTSLIPLNFVYRPKQSTKFQSNQVFSSSFKLDHFILGRILFWIGISGSVVSVSVLIITLIIVLGPVFKFFLFFLGALVFFILMTVLSIGMMKAPERKK